MNHNSSSFWVGDCVLKAKEEHADQKPAFVMISLALAGSVVKHSRVMKGNSVTTQASNCSEFLHKVRMEIISLTKVAIVVLCSQTHIESCKKEGDGTTCGCERHAEGWCEKAMLQRWMFCCGDPEQRGMSKSKLFYGGSERSNKLQVKKTHQQIEKKTLQKHIKHSKVE